jgi:hypothetical protein
MRQTFTIAGSIAFVSLFGIANAGYAQTVKADAPAAPGQNAVAVKAIAAKDGTFDVEITHNGKTRKFTGVKATPDGNFDLPELMELNPPAGMVDRKQRKVIKVESKPLIFPSGAAAAQAQSKSISVQAIGNGSGTFDVEITEDGKTRKVTGVTAGPDGSLDIPELNGDAPKGAKVTKQIKIINGAGDVNGLTLPTIIDGFNNEDVKVIVGSEPGAPGLPQPAPLYRPTTPLKKEVLIEAKLVNGKKVVAAPTLIVTSGQKAKIQAGDVWLSLSATISPAGTISLKGDAGSAKSPKGPGFSVSGLASGGSFKYPNGASGTWEIKASVSVEAAKP